MVYLQVTFTLEAQDVARFKRFYAESFLPVILDHGFSAVGIFETLIGPAGELTELWRFEDLQDYETKWSALMADPRVHEIFETTGPMVKNENFKLLTSAGCVPDP